MLLLLVLCHIFAYCLVICKGNKKCRINAGYQTADGYSLKTATKNSMTTLITAAMTAAMTAATTAAMAMGVAVVIVISQSLS